MLKWISSRKKGPTRGTAGMADNDPQHNCKLWLHVASNFAKLLRDKMIAFPSTSWGNKSLLQHIPPCSVVVFLFLWIYSTMSTRASTRLFWGGSTLSPEHWGCEGAKGGKNDGAVFITFHLIKTCISAYQCITDQLWVQFSRGGLVHHNGRILCIHLYARVRCCAVRTGVQFKYHDMFWMLLKSLRQNIFYLHGVDI